jgi:hypothetical protein
MNTFPSALTYVSSVPAVQLFRWPYASGDLISQVALNSPIAHRV